MVAPTDTFEQHGPASVEAADARASGEHGDGRSGAVVDGDPQCWSATRSRTVLAADLATETSGTALDDIDDRTHVDTEKSLLQAPGVELGDRSAQPFVDRFLGAHGVKRSGAAGAPDSFCRLDRGDQFTVPSHSGDGDETCPGHASQYSL